MATMQVDAPRRAQSFRAKIGRIVGILGISPQLTFLKRWRDPRQDYPRFTDQQARDVGLDLADLEWSNVQLPSQTTRHPML